MTRAVPLTALGPDDRAGEDHRGAVVGPERQPLDLVRRELGELIVGDGRGRTCSR